MTIQEIIRGESQNVEFKEMLPKNSEKYIKTIIAFANTQGGQLIVGIDDETQRVTGVDRDSVFKTMYFKCCFGFLYSSDRPEY